MNGKVKVLTIITLLVLAAIPTSIQAKIFFKPTHVATFTGAVSGGGFVEVIGNFMEIRSNPADNSIQLTFGNIFGDYAGSHPGYLYMKRTSSTDLTIEIHYTYRGEDEGGQKVYYHLHGFGIFDGNKKTGSFGIISTGTFTLSKDVGPTGNWIEVWRGDPYFTIEGKKI